MRYHNGSSNHRVDLLVIPIFSAVPFFITDINKRQNVNKSPSLIKYDIIKIYGKPKQCHGQPNEEKNSEHVKNRGRIIHSSYRIN